MAAAVPPPPAPVEADWASRRRGPPPAAGRRCRFGCGRPSAKPDGRSRRAYTTCCRACALCEGDGEHDAGCTGGPPTASSTSSRSGPLDAEAAALIAVDRALELRRRGKVSSDADGAQTMLRDSLQQLERARAGLPNSSELHPLFGSVLEAWRRDAGADNEETNDRFEAEVESRLERLLADLHAAVQTRAARARQLVQVQERTCKSGCGCLLAKSLPGQKPFDTCCRTCATSAGAGGHDPTCRGRPEPVGVGVGGSAGSSSSAATARPAEPSSELATTCTDIVPAGAPLVSYEPPAEGGESKTAGEPGEGGGAGAAGAGVPSSLTPAQAALRVLGLDDSWPTELTMREIRSRYLRQALATHPDKAHPEERTQRTERFQELSDAYNTLESVMAVLERIRGRGEQPVSEESGDLGGHSAAGRGSSKDSGAAAESFSTGEPSGLLEISTPLEIEDIVEDDLQEASRTPKADALACGFTAAGQECCVM